MSEAIQRLSRGMSSRPISYRLDLYSLRLASERSERGSKC
jgi:hypothetical protein